ncbi:MAG: 3-dehydroquinate synthase family protein [Acidimicrobiia bacterium]
MRRHVIWRAEEPISTIFIGRGVNEALTDIATSRPRQRAAILCQPPTAALAGSYASLLAKAGMEVKGYTVPDGEEAKQLGVVEDVYKFLNESGFTRDDLIIGVGGGAVTDLAGFVGGTYLRGVPVMYVATTLIAAVDAAIGGKTGVNVGGKNLAGVFAHPEAVLIDIDIIDQLPISLQREGAAEALKTGFIEDMAIVEAYERDGLGVDLEEIVNRSVAVKVAVVNDDFKERGRRVILNYGHTVGHAIETTTGRSHAESVSIGTVAAGAASRVMFDFTGEQRQRAILRKIGLPVAAPDADAQAVRAQMERDKKRDSDGLRMVLLQDFGIPQLVHADDATVLAAFEGIGLA